MYRAAELIRRLFRTMKGEIDMEENNQIIDVTDGKEKQAVLARDLLLLAGTLLLGVLFVTLFFNNEPGVSIPIFVLAFYAVMLPYSRKELVPGNIFGWFLILPILMLAMTYFIFADELFRMLNLLALPMLIILQTLLVTGRNSFKWDSPAILLDLFLGIFYRCVVHIGKPFRLLGRLLTRKSGGSRLSPSASRVLMGLLISLPIAIVLIVLLSSADMVFGSMMNRIPEFLRSLNLGDAIARIIVALVIFFLSFSYLWSIAYNDRPLNSLKEDIKGTLPKVWEPVTILTVTAAIDVIYIAFVFVQFTYLFGGMNFGLPADFTYSEYARRGFFELVAVTLINIGILACFLSFTKKTGARTALALRILYSVMIACTFVMLFSAHFRMSLYEEAYGYTYLRMFTHAFMVLLLALFLITLYRVWADGAPLLKPYLIAAIVAFVAINYLNVDALIANNNIERYNKTGKIDAAYLTRLSNDAIPRIAALAESNPELSGELGDFLDNKKLLLSADKGWQAFNLADYHARKALE
jgi:hypothetical protein